MMGEDQRSRQSRETETGGEAETDGETDARKRVH